MSSFFSELKRRNVVRVGVAYAVASWVIMQIIDVVVEPLNLPDWTATLVLVLLLIGLPVALIFSWAYELTPEGVKKTEEVDADASITHSTGRRLDRMIIGALVIAVALLVGDRFVPSSGEAPPVAPPVESVGQSIAVLPFLNLSEDKSNEYFSDGLSEELLNVLSQFPDLKVAGRTSSFAFKGKNQDLRLIGQALSVSTILEGSVRKQQNRVRITAQLIRVSDGFHIWSETFDRELEDIFAVQEEIATAIARALAIEMDIAPGQSLVRARTSNMAAYNHYLEARTLIARRLDLGQSIQLLSEVTRQDPDFAPAWGALAQAHALALYYGPEAPQQALVGAETAARRALELDPNLATAHSVLGDVNRDRFQWMEAKNHYLRAFELNPDDVELLSQYSQMLTRVRRFDAAMPYAQKAVELDPLSWIRLTIYGQLLYISGDKEAGWQHVERAMALSGRTGGYVMQTAVGMAFDDGDVDKVVALLRNKDVLPDLKAFPDEFFGLLDDRRAALEYLAAHFRDDSRLTVLNLYWAVYLDDMELAQEMIEFSLEEAEKYNSIFDFTWLNHDFQRQMRQTETFKDAFRRLGILDYWRADGWPEDCRPLEGDDFECD